MTIKLTKISYFPKGTVISIGVDTAIRRYNFYAERVPGQPYDGNNNPNYYWNWPPIDQGSGYTGYGNSALDALISSQPVIGYLVQEDWVDSYGTQRYWKLSPHPPSGSVTVEGDRTPQYLEVINSSNTLGWPGTQGPRSAGLALTKSKFTLKRPKKPLYSPPKFRRATRPVSPARVSLQVIPPSRFPGEGSEAYQIRLDRWTAALNKRELKLDNYRWAKYQQRLAKYESIMKIRADKLRLYDAAFTKRQLQFEERLAKFLKLEAESKIPRYKKAPTYDQPFPQDNYYGRIQMFVDKPIERSRGGSLYYRAAQDIGDPEEGWGYYPYLEDQAPYQVLYWAGSNGTLTGSATDTADITRYAEDVRLRVISAFEPLIEERDTKLRRKIHQKLKGQVTHVGNLLAERKQTFDLVQSSLKRILSLVKAKKTILKAVVAYAKTPKSIANDVLAFKFGVEPLAQDVMGFAKYIDELSDSPTVVARVNLGPSKTVPFTVTDGPILFEGMVDISYVVKCVISNPAARPLSQFGLINPLEIAWEALPWSFVVDWVLPVGNWLSSQTAECGLTFKTGTRTVRYTGTFTILPTTQSSGSPLGGSGKPMVFNGEVLERKVLSELPDVPMPAIKNPWSWSHGIESVALAIQKLRR